MSKTDKLERQIRETRSQLCATLEALRYWAKPQRVLSETTDGLKRSSAARFLTNFEADVMSNSVPLTLLAAGLGWLIFRPGNRNQSASDNAYALALRRLAQMSKVAGRNASSARAAVQSGAAIARARVGSISRQLAETANAVSQTAKSTTAATTQAGASTVEAARSTMKTVRNSAASAAKTVSTAARGTANTVEKHPALFAGTAVALGGTVALGIFLGRSLRDEVARLNEIDRPTERITPERALALVDESALSLVPAVEFDEHNSPTEAEQEDQKEPVASLNKL
jgi:Protein of unknown function (DUF3618)